MSDVVQNRELLKARLIDEFEARYGPSPHTKEKHGAIHFSFKKLNDYLDHLDRLPAWQMTPKNRLKTAEELHAKNGSCLHPALQPLADLMKRIGDFRQFGLTIGSDDRARYPVMPFKSDTGKKPTQSSRFIFAQSSWTRGLVKPGPGDFVAYVDWSAAEFAIAGVLSKDAAMINAYNSGDPTYNPQSVWVSPPKGRLRRRTGSIRDVFKNMAPQRSIRRDSSVPCRRHCLSSLHKKCLILSHRRRTFWRSITAFIAGIGSGLRIACNFSDLKPTAKKHCMGGVIG